MKVEANTVLRGALFEPRELPLCDAAQAEFGRFVAATVVSDAELFGGKLVAALDRQHPRDLFDARYILDAAVATTAGPDKRLRLGFLAMLLSHDRPPHEVLAPNAQNRAAAFASQFAGMSREPFDAENGRRAFDDLVARLPSLLPFAHRLLLLSFIEGEPDWTLIASPMNRPLADLPAVRWKLENVRRLRSRNPEKQADQVARLRDWLDAMPDA